MALAGFVAVAIVRALTLPRSLWEWDEILFARAIERFDPLGHQPHPPGYPLLVGLGKLLDLVFHDPFVSLVALSFVSSLIGYWALVAAFRRIAGGTEGNAERVAVGGALLFHLSPAMLVQGPLPMSDPPALMFLSLALAAAAALREKGSVWAALGLGAAASAAVGCRPQLALAVLPMLAVALWPASGWRRRLEAVAAFAIVSLLWFIPLVAAVGGPSAFLDYQGRQAAYLGAHDAALRGSTVKLAWLFVAHPWGPAGLALGVLALALAGIVALARERRAAALPLAVLSGVQLLICLRVMDPADGVRYALPSLLGVAFAAAAGSAAAARLLRRPAAARWAPILVAVLVTAAGLFYAGPFLRVRATTLSPAARAALWAERHRSDLQADLLVEPEMEPFAAYLLRDLDPVKIDEGLSLHAQHPYAPLYLLAEGESSWPGAANFHWPDSPAYQRLTRNHYRAASVSVIPTGRRFQPVRGVYSWEPSLRRPGWRWLEPDAAIRVVLPRTRAIVMRLALPPKVPLASNTVAVSVNGQPAGTVEIAPGLERTLELPVQGRTLEIAFRSARWFVPAQAGMNADTRRLAVQLLAVERLPR